MTETTTEIVRNTPDNYDGSKILIIPDTSSRKHGKTPLPFGKIQVMSKKKKPIHYTLHIEDAFVSNWFGDPQPRDDGTLSDVRTVIVKFFATTPNRDKVVKFFRQFTKNINWILKESPGIWASLQLPDDHVMPNPLLHDEEKDEYFLYANVRLKNMVDTKKNEELDFGKFLVEDGHSDTDPPKRIPLKVLKTHGFNGSITNMQFELKGKKEKNGSSTMHIDCKLFAGVAGELVLNNFKSTADVRQKVKAKYGSDAAAKMKELIDAAGDDDDDLGDAGSTARSKARVKIADDENDDDSDSDAPPAKKPKQQKKTEDSDEDKAAPAKKPKKQKENEDSDETKVPAAKKPKQQKKTEDSDEDKAAPAAKKPKKKENEDSDEDKTPATKKPKISKFSPADALAPDGSDDEDDKAPAPSKKQQKKKPPPEKESGSDSE